MTGAEDEDEVLQTRVIPLEEVRKDLNGWKAAFQKEYDSLLAGPVVPIFDKDLEEMEKQGVKTEILPAKAIASKKPPNRRKARIVVCGNYAQQHDHQDISVGGVCAMAVRGVVHRAACDELAVGSLDVTGAFLQAPRRQSDVTTIVQPPRLLQQLGIISSQEKWRVACALYGMVESPADWAVFRDGKMKLIRWVWNGVTYWLQKTPEQHLWKVKKEVPGSDGACTAGWIAVYVDDFLIAMKADEIQGAFQALGETWKCSEPEMVTEGASMRFCGYEIARTSTGGYTIKQTGYIQDILDKYNITEEDAQPLPRIEDEDDESNPSIDMIRRAQAVVGELQWVTHRTRPDVSYATGVLARLLHRRPTWVVQAGQQVLRYLNKTKHLGLRYEKFSHPGDATELKIYADASFAPPHEKYRSVHGILTEHGNNVIAWESGRQAFVTQSTAEAELIGYNEAFQVGEAVGALLQVLEFDVSKKLMGDSKAAIAQLVGDTGPWRTRHLRLRSAKLRETLQDPAGAWEVEHKRGSELAADGLTKPLQGQAFRKFTELLRMESSVDVGSCTGGSEPQPKVASVGVDAGRNHQIALGACLAAVAMLKFDPVVVSVVAALAFALREVVGRNKTRPAKRATGQTRPQSPEKTTQKEEGGQQSMDRSGTVKEAGAGKPQEKEILGNHLRSSVEPTQPGIKALRTGERSHGSSQARERGKAAMALLRRQQASRAVEAEDASTVKSAGESVDSDSGLEEIPADASLRTLLGNLSIADDGDTVRENLRDSVAAGASSSSQPQREVAAAGRSSQSVRELAKAGVSSQSVQEQHGVSQSVPVTGSASSGSHGEAVREPWKLPAFQRIDRSSKDRWNLTLWSQGWAIREHRKPRVRAYIPVHTTTPFDCAEIESERVTLKVKPKHEVITDQWTTPSTWRGEVWQGFTFFRLKQADDDFEIIR